MPKIDWTKVGQQQSTETVPERPTYATGMSFDMEIDAIELVPLYEQLVPRPSADEYAQLKADIEAHGIQIPLLIDNYGRLIDGYTRYQIAKELGLKDVPVIVDEFTEESAQLRVIELNLHRRQLTDTQRVELGAKIIIIEKARAKERMERTQFAKKEDLPATPAAASKPAEITPTNSQTGMAIPPTPSEIKPTPTGETSIIPPTPSQEVPEEKKAPTPPVEAGSSIEKTADKVGLKPTKLKQGLLVLEESKKNPEAKKAWDAAKAGKKSINQAFKETKRAQIQEDMKKNPPKEPSSGESVSACKILWGDAFTALANPAKFPLDSIPLILTSTPYGADKDDEETGPGYVEWEPETWEQQFKHFANLAKRGLTKNGILITILGVQTRRLKNGVTEHLPLDSFAIPICRKEGLGLVRQITWAFKAGKIGGKNSLNGRHESVCIFAKGPGYTFNGDDIRVPAQTEDSRNPPDGLVNPGDVWFFERVTNMEKQRRGLIHPCIFPAELIERLILLCSKSGDLILDPFVGSGTTLEVASRLKRRAIGIEINKHYQADVRITLGDMPYSQEDL